MNLVKTILNQIAEPAAQASTEATAKAAEQLTTQQNMLHFVEQSDVVGKTLFVILCLMSLLTWYLIDVYKRQVLVFVDTMKELSITLLLRPMNFETLATWLYAEAARGTYEEGVIAALLIVAVGLMPVIFLARSQEKIKYLD